MQLQLVVNEKILQHDYSIMKDRSCSCNASIGVRRSRNRIKAALYADFVARMHCILSQNERNDEDYGGDVGASFDKNDCTDNRIANDDFREGISLGRPSSFSSSRNPREGHDEEKEKFTEVESNLQSSFQLSSDLWKKITKTTKEKVPFIIEETWKSLSASILAKTALSPVLNETKEGID